MSSNIMDGLFELRSYIIHRLRAGGPHTVHSPQVFDLLTKVLSPDRVYYCFDEIEALRKELLASDEHIEVEDFGAGARNRYGRIRRVSDIARTSLQSPSCARALFRIVEAYRPSKILELGTSFGITTCYMAQAAAQSHITTIEGAAQIARIAQDLFMRQGLSNVDVIQGNFDDVLDETLRDMTRVDLAVLDGNHRLEPTLRYFEAIRPYCSQGSVVILDDLYWSHEMKKAWSVISARKDVALSIDFFHFGMIFLREGVEKQHFVLRMPA